MFIPNLKEKMLKSNVELRKEVLSEINSNKRVISKTDRSSINDIKLAKKAFKESQQKANFKSINSMVKQQILKPSRLNNHVKQYK